VATYEKTVFYWVFNKKWRLMWPEDGFPRYVNGSTPQYIYILFIYKYFYTYTHVYIYYIYILTHIILQFNHEKPNLHWLNTRVAEALGSPTASGPGWCQPLPQSCHL
jgi:hypothetical protein